MTRIRSRPPHRRALLLTVPVMLALAGCAGNNAPAAAPIAWANLTPSLPSTPTSLPAPATSGPPASVVPAPADTSSPIADPHDANSNETAGPDDEDENNLPENFAPPTRDPAPPIPTSAAPSDPPVTKAPTSAPPDAAPLPQVDLPTSPDNALVPWDLTWSDPASDTIVITVNADGCKPPIGIYLDENPATVTIGVVNIDFHADCSGPLQPQTISIQLTDPLAERSLNHA